MVWLLLLTVARAWASPAHDALDAGDRAWLAGDRDSAWRSWRQAVRLAVDDPAVEAMARLRLLSVSGNLGGLWHGLPADRALRTATGPWGLLAEADFHLWAPAEVGAEPARALPLAEQASTALPGPAAARAWLATHDGAWWATLQQATVLDGLGEGLLAADGQWPTTPGTWFLGLGIAAAPGAGVGGSVVFVHPDLGWEAWRLTATASGSSRGEWAGSLAVRTPGPFSKVVWGAGGHGVVDVWTADAPTPTPWDRASGGAALGHAVGPAWVELGGVARWDRVDGGAWLAGHGPLLKARWGVGSGWSREGRGLTAEAQAGAQLVDYLGVRLDAKVVGSLPSWGVTVARIGWQQELAVAAGVASPAPVVLWPSAGGSDVLRGAPAGRFRAPGVGAVDIEQRWRPVTWLEPVVFVDGAWVQGDGPHGGGGAGVRLRLPPRALNIVRLEVAVSDVGWGVIAGWGEPF